MDSSLLYFSFVYTKFKMKALFSLCVFFALFVFASERRSWNKANSQYFHGHMGTEGYWNPQKSTISFKTLKLSLKRLNLNLPLISIII